MIKWLGRSGKKKTEEIKARKTNPPEANIRRRAILIKERNKGYRTSTPGKFTETHWTISKDSQVSACAFEMKVLFPNIGNIGEIMSFIWTCRV